MQSFCSCKLICMTPYANHITAMLAQMETVRMSNYNLIKLILSVILSIEQPFV